MEDHEACLCYALACVLRQKLHESWWTLSNSTMFASEYVHLLIDFHSQVLNVQSCVMSQLQSFVWSAFTGRAWPVNALFSLQDLSTVHNHQASTTTQSVHETCLDTVNCIQTSLMYFKPHVKCWMPSTTWSALSKSFLWLCTMEIPKTFGPLQPLYSAKDQPSWPCCTVRQFQMIPHWE